MKNIKVKTDLTDLKSVYLYACDFETTTAEYSREYTKVWSFCYDEIGKYKPQIYSSIQYFFDFCGDETKGTNKILYFHNLKFDGEFILYSALHDYNFTCPIFDGKMVDKRKIINNEIVYLISDTGQWYSINFKYKNCKIEIRDSLKLMPFTLAEIGKAFCKKYKKSSMNYDGFSDLSQCTENEIDYIKNDVLVLSEALSFIMKQNREESPFPPIKSLTIGSACYQQFKKFNYGDKHLFDCKLNEISIDFNEYGSITADEYIRKAYRGGYCYVNPKIKGKLLNCNGFTADVNSLYPFVMSHEKSGFKYPCGKPVFRKGKVLNEYINNDKYYFFARIKVAFTVKDGYVPTIQKKNSFLFLQNEYLESSAYMDYKTREYVGDPQMIDITLTKYDYILFFEHYNIIDIEFLDYCLFQTFPYFFDEYIRYFENIKVNSSGATRTLAKLFSNNIYGQMSKSDNSSFKVANLKDDELSYYIISEHEKKIVNIAIGAAITAHARFYQIKTIQNNIDSFCYSDTDSLHCIGNPGDFIGDIDDKKYGCYKIEGEWNKAIFLRQKTYIENIVDFDNLSFTPSICCAGMTKTQKDYFVKHLSFVDFKTGLTISGGKLRPVHVKGGIILEDVDFTLK